MATLYDRYARRFFAYLRSRKIELDTAEDIVQRVFLKFISGRGKILESARAYLWQMLRNELTDELRKRRRTRERFVDQPVPMEDDDVSFEAWVEKFQAAQQGVDSRLEQQDCLDQAWARLVEESPDKADLVTLDIYDGLSGAELAALLGKTEVAARQAKSAAFRMFRTILMALCPGLYAERVAVAAPS